MSLKKIPFFTGAMPDMHIKDDCGHSSNAVNKEQSFFLNSKHLTRLRFSRQERMHVLQNPPFLQKTTLCGLKSRKYWQSWYASKNCNLVRLGFEWFAIH